MSLVYLHQQLNRSLYLLTNTKVQLVQDYLINFSSETFGTFFVASLAVFFLILSWTHIHLSKLTNTFLSIPTFTNSHTRTQNHVNTHLRSHALTLAHTHSHALAHTHTHSFALTRAHTHTRPHTLTNIRIFTAAILLCQTFKATLTFFSHTLL